MGKAEKMAWFQVGATQELELCRDSYQDMAVPTAAPPERLSVDRIPTSTDYIKITFLKNVAPPPPPARSWFARLFGRLTGKR